MNNKQRENAHKWYRDHYQHVNRLLDSMEDKTVKIPPADTSRPELWKPIHWNWFLSSV